MGTRGRSARRTRWATATRCSRSRPAAGTARRTCRIIGALAADAMAEGARAGGHAGDGRRRHSGRAGSEEVAVNRRSLARLLLGLLGRRSIGARPVDRPPRHGREGLLRRRPRARSRPHLLDDARGEHRRGIDGRRDRRSATGTASRRGGGSDRPALGSLILAFWIGPAMRRARRRARSADRRRLPRAALQRRASAASSRCCCGSARSPSSPDSSSPSPRSSTSSPARRSGSAARSAAC